MAFINRKLISIIGCLLIATMVKEAVSVEDVHIHDHVQYSTVYKDKRDNTLCNATWCDLSCRETTKDQLFTGAFCTDVGSCRCEWVYRCDSRECDVMCRNRYGPDAVKSCHGNRECQCNRPIQRPQVVHGGGSTSVSSTGSSTGSGGGTGGDRCYEGECRQICVERTSNDLILDRSNCAPQCRCHYIPKCRTKRCELECQEQYRGDFETTQCSPQGRCQCVAKTAGGGSGGGGFHGGSQGSTSSTVSRAPEAGTGSTSGSSSSTCQTGECLADCRRRYPEFEGKYVRTGECRNDRCECRLATRCKTPACDRMCREEYRERYANEQLCDDESNCVCKLKRHDSINH